MRSYYRIFALPLGLLWLLVPYKILYNEELPLEREGVNRKITISKVQELI
jgi:hypothetical protein